MYGEALGSLVAAISGLALLWWSGDVVVHYALELARIHRVSVFFVGFMMYSLAANLPELSVAIASALSGVSQVSAGDLVGANFSDIGMVLGITIFLSRGVFLGQKDCRFLLGLLGLLALMMCLLFSVGVIWKYHGVGLLIIYFFFVLFIWKNRKHRDFLNEHDDVLKTLSRTWYQTSFMVAKVLVSGILVVASSAFSVRYAVSFAVSCHLPLETVGATLIAIGTSLPELVLSLNAMRRGKYSFIFGPMLGNVFGHGTLILGVLSILSDKPINIVPLRGAILFMIPLFSVLAYGLYRRRITRATGFFLFLIFVLYLVYFFMPTVDVQELLSSF